MRVLMIANYLPYPELTGGRIRVYNLLRRVAQRHEVSLAALLESPEDVEGVPHLQQFCAAVETASFPAHQRSRLAKAPGMLRYVLERKPPDLMLLHSQELLQKIRQLFSTAPFDIVQIESVMGLYLEGLPPRGAYRSLEMFQNITSHQLARISDVERRGYERLRARITSISMRHWEPRYAENFDRCTTVSKVDQELLMKANPRLRVDVIPNGVDTQKYQPLPLPSETASPSLMFIGSMGYPPCVDAVLYFHSDILPLIRQVITPVQFRVVGRDPPPEVLKLNGTGVHVTGRVEDVVPFYQQSTVCVVPLRAGGGTRLKILEAMALGRPVVSTTIGCEGLDVVDGKHLLVADTPEQFAAHTLRLLNDRHLVRHLCANARQLVEARYSWDSIAERLMEVYEEMIANPNK
jgi:sugar transferase (PEP-CTERM/EpsH1 system associated)